MGTCPDCGAGLLASREADGVRYPCPSCAGVAVTLPVLRRLATPARASELWLHSAQGPAEGRACPFCGLALRTSTLGNLRAGVCRTCEAVWLDAGALAQLTGNPVGAPVSPQGDGTDPAAGPDRAGGPQRCPDCGAPRVVDPSGVCHWCHALLPV